MTPVLNSGIIYIPLFIIGMILVLKLKKHIHLLILLAIQQLIYIFFNVFFESSLSHYAPLLLLNGPILYFICSNSQSKNIPHKIKFIHLLPLVWVILQDNLIYVFAQYKYGHHSASDVNILLGSISQIIYASWIMGIQQREQDQDNSTISLIRQISVLLIINSVLNILIHQKNFRFRADFGFDGDLLSYLPFLLSIVLIVRDLLLDRLEKRNPGRRHSNKSSYSFLENSGTSTERYRFSPLDAETLKDIEIQINSYLEEEKIYLQADITLESFADQIQVSKNHLSQVLNTHMGKNFYRLMAEYRIEYAIELLKTNKNLKIEALAYDCGFNSISTFNRYFKEIKGMQPSAYIKTL